MSRLNDALKELGKKLNTGGTAPSGELVEDIINNMAESFDITGAAGASITAISLTTTAGLVTGGTATLSDGTTVDITVSEAE